MQHLHLFGFMCPLYRYASGLPCVRSTSRGGWRKGGKRGVHPAYRCWPFNFYCFWRPAPRQAATNSYAIFVFIFHMQPHTAPRPRPRPSHSPGAAHTHTCRDTHTHTHTCRESMSRRSLGCLRFASCDILNVLAALHFAFTVKCFGAQIRRRKRRDMNLSTKQFSTRVCPTSP